MQTLRHVSQENLELDMRSSLDLRYRLSWSSRKQSVIALSTCEAEYYALTEGGKEAMHIKKLVCDFFCCTDRGSPVEALQRLAVKPKQSTSGGRHQGDRLYLSKEG